MIQLNNLTWEEAYWLRNAVLIASRHVAKGSRGWQAYNSIIDKLTSAEDGVTAQLNSRVEIPPVKQSGGDRP